MSKENDRMEPDAQLNADLASLRDKLPEMPEGLEARMLATAYSEQPVAVAVDRQRPPVIAGRVARLLGGWLTAGALGAASATGIALGYAGPEVMPDIYATALSMVEGIEEVGFEDPLDAFEEEVGI